jgi:uncharacterized membrane protein YozB (DUF420 family)
MPLIEQLPHVNAALNLLATTLLILGYYNIRRRKEAVHKRLMVSSFVTSIAFLVCYLVYHGNVSSRRFPTSAPPLFRYGYYAMLASHVILAAMVPVLASITLYLGIRNDRARHRRWARWTFPIWLYVSITGVLVYFSLYWVYPAPAESPIIVE